MFTSSATDKTSFLMQRYIPPLSNEKSALVLRCCWKKDVGFKVHRLQSLVPSDGRRLFDNLSEPS